MWAHLALETVAWVFWLSGWAATASWASDKDELSKEKGKPYSYWATAAAGAGLGAIMWYVHLNANIISCTNENGFSPL